MVALQNPKRGLTVFEVLVCIALIAVFLGLLLPSINAARDHHGKPIPELGPNEDLRAFDENGMSIVVPVDWWHSPSDFAFCGGGRFCSRLFAEQLPSDFDDATYIDRWVYNSTTVPSRQSKIDNGGGPKGRNFRFEFIVTEGETRYLVGYNSRESISELPEIVSEYLQTFRPPIEQSMFGEPSDAPESASRSVSNMEDQPRGPGDR